MPFKRKRSNSVVDLTSSTSPLPVPLTAKPLGPRPTASSISSGSHGVKRTRPNGCVVDVDDFSEPSKPVAGPSRLLHEVIDVEDEISPWREDDCQDSFDSDQLAKLLRAKNARQTGQIAVEGQSNPSTPTGLLAPPSRSNPSTPPPSNLLSTHTCPICFSTVTNACLTPCGHLLCGSCLFASVKTGVQRALEMAIPMGGDGTAARFVIGINGIV